MPNFAIVTGNLVTNIILADSLAIAQELSPNGSTAIQSDTAGIGCTFDGTNFIPAPQPEVKEPNA